MNIRIVLLLLLALPVVLGASADLRYEIRGSQVSVEYLFSDVEQPFELEFPQDSQLPTRTIRNDTTVAFVSSQYLAGDTFQLNLRNFETNLSEVRVYLPPGATLTRTLESPQPSVTPQPRDAFSDGQRLILLWEPQDIEPAQAIIIEYDTQSNNSWIILFALLLLVLVIAVLRKHQPRQNDITKNLFEEEKQIVEVLLEQPKHEMWQNSLVKETQMSKVKISRKLRNLEKKGVIQKIPHGNTNKIRLIE